MSGTVRFISDLHLGHENMAKKRGFSCARDMNDLILSRWQDTVKKGDVTYILGDLTMERKQPLELLSKLRGHIKVILGNHDRPQDVKEIIKYVNWVGGMYQIKVNGGKDSAFLTHCPIHPNELDYRVKWNICGHTHENSIPDPRYINVSAEVIDYTPKTFEELIKINQNEH